MADDRQEAFNKTHPGFRIICLNCGSEAVYVENTQGWSELSGSWGDVELICADCNQRVDIA